MKMRDAGLLSKWYEENKKDIPVRKCQETRKTSNEAIIKPLTLKNLLIVFVALVAGIIVSTIIIIVENILFHKVQK